MKKRRTISSAWLPLILTGGMIGGIFIGRYLTMSELSPMEMKLRTIMGLIDKDYVDKINVDSLLDATLPTLLASLDPHSAYISKDEITAVNEDLDSSFSGVGVSFQILNDSVTIVEVISGGPAEKVGLKPGDRIISANGTQLSGVQATNEDVFKTLRGKEGTKVELTIKRSNSKKPLKFDVIRGEIPMNSVDSHYMIAQNIGYVKVGKFARNTYQEFLNALSDLKDKGAKKYIVDLRGNAGGYMDQAIYMANEFLPAGKTIVYTKARRPENETLAISDGNGSFQDAELVVIVNEYSASASEIFSGAIQDNDRGLVIGRRSFGKGLVQNQTMLPDSSAIRLTVARYYTPSGRSIQKEYKRGKDGKYDLDLLDRYTHGEFYSADSIKIDKTKVFHTIGGRKVYGGGGIMPDIFVPEDTVGMTSYYVAVANAGLIGKYAFYMTDRHRDAFDGVKSVDELMKILPRDGLLLDDFVNYAVRNGVPARWYYIGQSRNLLLRNIKAVIARDVLGYDELNQVLNDGDPTVQRAVKELKEGHSPVLIKKK
jgi:carboxyl-terminal processing protease